MNEFQRNRTKSHHVVIDAFGRQVDLGTHAEPWQAQACACHRDRLSTPRAARRSRGSVTAVSIAAVLVGGLVLAVLLLVIRDIVIAAIASSSLAGLAVRWLLTSTLRPGE